MLVINEDNLSTEEVQEFSEKVRAILVDENNRILIAHYGNVILLPGGSIEANENIYDAIKRELSEETGQVYEAIELEPIGTLKHFQKNYPKRDGTTRNRLVQTHYFTGTYKVILKDNQSLTEKEHKDGFKLELLSLEELERIIATNQSANPRNIYFRQELLAILNAYKNFRRKLTIKKITLKQ